MRYMKGGTTIVVDALEQEACKEALETGVTAIESMIASLDALCHWDKEENDMLRAIRAERQALVGRKARLHDFIVALS